MTSADKRARAEGLLSSAPFDFGRYIEQYSPAHWIVDAMLAFAAECEQKAIAEERARSDVYRMERNHWQEKFDLLIKHLSHIHALIAPPDQITSDGKRFKFHPPEELVREVWEGLSNAIREIPDVIAKAEAIEKEPTK